MNWKSRNTWARNFWLIVIGVGLGVAAGPSSVAADRPNVLLIMTDDQGYGDLGVHGNPIIQTPHLDRLAHESVRLETFCVSPVCSPTRASLMTGRYNYRTGVYDTHMGGSMMHPDEVTLAEMLAGAGYRTAIFGKWHLGDHCPMRPQDQGFQEVLVHRGGGIGQTSDDPPGDHYLDPTLLHNGTAVKQKGYVTDVLTDAAIDFIADKKAEPFFVYLAYNCPHDPLEAPEAYLARYRSRSLAADQFPSVGYPLEGRVDEHAAAHVYAMVANIDDNIGRLLERLAQLNLAENTIVVFLTDNGPQQVRYNAGFRGRKKSVHEGGIRVPCFVRWPGRLEGNRSVREPAAHIDLAPTLVDACGVDPPRDVKFDGVSLMPLLTGSTDTLPDRTLFFQWHRGGPPQLHRAFAARGQRFKLTQALGAETPLPPNAPLELYDLEADPYEQHNIAAERQDVVAELNLQYKAWFADMTSGRGFSPWPILVGSRRENPVALSRQDWTGPLENAGPAFVGHWKVEVDQPGRYTVRLRFAPLAFPAVVRLKLGGISRERTLAAGISSVTFEDLELPAGPTVVAPRLMVDGKALGTREGIQYVDIARVE